MSLFIFLTVVQAIIAALLVGVILMQKSEGGGLGVGGSPAGLMSARGAADFLTRATTILAVLFVTLSIVLAALAWIDTRSGLLPDALTLPLMQFRDDAATRCRLLLFLSLASECGLVGF